MSDLLQEKNEFNCDKDLNIDDKVNNNCKKENEVNLINRSELNDNLNDEFSCASDDVSNDCENFCDKRNLSNVNIVSNNVNNEQNSETKLNLNQSCNETSDNTELNQSVEQEKIIHTHYNPFGDTDDEDENDDVNLDAIKDKIKYPDDLNPFGDEDDSDEDCDQESITNRTKDSKTTSQTVNGLNSAKPKTSLNPFGSDDDSDEGDDSKNSKPVTPTPAPRRSLQNKTPAKLSPFSSNYSYTTSSLERKKKPDTPPRPPPPSTSLTDVDQNLNDSFANISIESQNKNSLSPANALTTRKMKKRAAPKPPGLVQSNSSSNSIVIDDNCSVTSDTLSNNDLSDLTSPSTPDNLRRKLSGTLSSEIDRRDSLVSPNSLTISEPVSESESVKTTSSSKLNQNDSETPSPMHRRKKKKQQAPPIPIPKRRIVTHSLSEIQDELNSIGDRLVVNDSRTKEITETMIKDGEKRKHKKLMYEYLILAQEKCSLARKQEELMYMKREHKLEEEHSDIEFKLRVIMAKLETMKSSDDDEKEKELLQRLLEIIEERNDIVENIMKIDKRPDFFALVEKLKEMKGATLVQPILNSFMKISYNENQVKVSYTKKTKSKEKKHKNKNKQDKNKQNSNEQNINENLKNKTEKIGALKTLKRIAKVI